jgi:hypothetical protein
LPRFDQTILAASKQLITKKPGSTTLRYNEYSSHYDGAIKRFSETVSAICARCEEPKIGKDQIDLSDPLGCTCTCDRVAKLLTFSRALKKDLSSDA